MATSQIETVSTGADKAKLAVAGVFVVAAIAAYYLLARQGALAQWGALIVCLALAAAAFGTSESGRRLIAFGRDAWREVKKVVWPTRKEAVQMTGFVFAFVVVMSVLMWIIDKGLEWVIFNLILGWNK
jgi:preprotein translocase subunit SecE